MVDHEGVQCQSARECFGIGLIIAGIVVAVVGFAVFVIVGVKCLVTYLWRRKSTKAKNSTSVDKQSENINIDGYTEYKGEIQEDYQELKQSENINIDSYTEYKGEMQEDYQELKHNADNTDKTTTAEMYESVENPDRGNAITHTYLSSGIDKITPTYSEIPENSPSSGPNIHGENAAAKEVDAEYSYAYVNNGAEETSKRKVRKVPSPPNLQHTHDDTLKSDGYVNSAILRS